ncbi:MAG: hypothetical protein ACLGHY_08765 [Gammaproteobacteria bacterium]
MMALLRLVALLGLGAVSACVIAWFFTRERRWLGRAMLAFKITLAVAVLFFAGVIGERLWETG